MSGVTGLPWVPDGSALQFSVNERAARDEKAYGATDLYRVSREGQLARLTNDGHNYTGVSFSPDGRWMVYARALSTQKIVDERMTHGRRVRSPV